MQSENAPERIDDGPASSEVREYATSSDFRSYTPLGSSFVSVSNTPFGVADESPWDMMDVLSNVSHIAIEQTSTNDAYRSECIVSSDERVNGFHLYDANLPLVSRGVFYQLVEVWNIDSNRHDDDDDDFDAFVAQCTQLMCSDWRRMDACGVMFEGDQLYENNPDVTLRSNILALFRLPYPLRVILFTIEEGCLSGKECVRYSNFVCEWISRKYASLHQSATLARRTSVLPANFDEHAWLHHLVCSDRTVE